MTANEARRLADDMADDIRRSITLRPNLKREGWALRIITVPSLPVAVALTSGASMYHFTSREAWEDQKDLIR